MPLVGVFGWVLMLVMAIWFVQAIFLWALHSGPFQPNQALATADGGLRGSAPSCGGRQESFVAKKHLGQDQIGPTKSGRGQSFSTSRWSATRYGELRRYLQHVSQCFMLRAIFFESHAKHLLFDWHNGSAAQEGLE